jgi:hypothetical protein
LKKLIYFACFLLCALAAYSVGYLVVADQVSNREFMYCSATLFASAFFILALLRNRKELGA